MPIAVRMDWSAPAIALDGGSRVAHVEALFDGRLDNQQELAAALHAGPRDSPAALLANAYLAWGDSCVDRLRGDFAVVLWDARERRLVAARDPFGVRPLYYREDAGVLQIDAEVLPLLRAGASPQRLNEHRVVEYLLGRYTAADATFFADIHEVPAGHVTVATARGVEHKPYFRPPLARWRGGDARREFLEEYKRLFLQAVERRLRSASPVTIHISGGLDSSAIAAAADVVAHSAGAAVPALRGAAARHPGVACDESAFIDMVARHVTFPVETWDGTDGKVEDLLDPRVEEPGLRSIVYGGTTGDLAIARSSGGSVILSGVGGDELGMVDGYVRDLLTDGAWGEALREILFFDGATNASRLGRVRHLVGQYLPLSLDRARARVALRMPDWLATDLKPLAREISMRQRAPRELAFNVQRAAWIRVRSQTATRTVSRMNAHAKAHGIEYRFPFLDRDLVEFALGVPYRFWPRPAASARLHREALRDLLPRGIAERTSKAEFTSLLARRIRMARSVVDDLLGSQTWACSRFVDRAVIRRFWQGVAKDGSGDSPSSPEWRQLWAVLTVEAWLTRVFEYHTGRPPKEDRRARAT